MYKNNGNASGFEVTYSVPVTHSGWPDEVHLYGTTQRTALVETITFSNAIESVRISTTEYGLVGFEFTEVGGNV